MLGIEDLIYLALDQHDNIIAAFAYKQDADEFVETNTDCRVVVDRGQE